MNLAPKQKEVMDACIKQGVYELPDSLRDAPKLWEGLALYYQAFFDLHSCRQRGEGIGPIDWLAIDRYCERNGIEGEQYEDMHFFIARMDHAYLEDVAKQQEKKLTDASKKHTPPKSRSPVRRRR